LTLQLGNALLGVLQLQPVCFLVSKSKLLNLCLDLGKHMRQRLGCPLEVADILYQVSRVVVEDIRKVGTLRWWSNQGQGWCHLRRYLDPGSTSDLGSGHA
jgi:hypothetical protein